MPDDLPERLTRDLPERPARPLSRRLTARHWTLLDGAIATAAAANAAALAATRHPDPRGPVWDLVRYAAIAAVCLPLPWRRRRPVAVLAVISGAVAVSMALHSNAWLVQLATLAMYSMAAVTPRRRSLTALAAGVLVVFGGALAGASGSLSGALGSGVLLLVGGWLVGENTRRRRAYEKTLAERAMEREAQREQRIRQAAMEERIHIARELHDSLAHAMSVITVRSGIARMLIESRPDEARNALGIIESTSRGIMQEMRLLLGVLRTPHAEADVPEADAPVAPVAPAPGLDHLDELLARVQQAGVQVDLRAEGTPRALPDSIGRSAYRIIQEALTNVVRHAGATSARLRVSYHPEDLAIEIVDNGTGGTRPADAVAPPGTAAHGLVGMRERVHLFGGEFSAGPLPEGGFRVLARIPTDEDTA
ncbi:sensor histidine kinase [Streptomyces sp. NPDC050788]|jgi:signal transduction histidine kinase|uniref:sensor histidine kinase n=1 Tax=Streptomyces sp. NPDC050788 TaxID=3155041 RepID=UPI003439217F